MSEQRQAKKMHVTAIGTVGSYPYLQKPDRGNENFPKPRGEWSCKLAVPSAKAQKTIDAIVAASTANYENYENVVYPKAVAEAKKAGKRPPSKQQERDYPFFEDDNGNVVFTFKAHASWVDKKTNETKAIELRIYDTKGQRVMPVPNINRGSEGRVEFSILPYQSAVAGCGVKLQLSKFQLTNLVEYAGGGNDSFGCDFDEEVEGGYTAPAKDEFAPAQEEVAQEQDFDEDIDF